MSVLEQPQTNWQFLDMQAALGITKHIGGLAATDELLALCHLDAAHTVLSIGCGIGVEPAYIAAHYPCHVVGIDRSPPMITWSRRRVHDAGVATQVELHPADVLALPFASESFDAVICESVLIFVPDKMRAIQECVRVTRPGGYVGLNEGFWFTRPAPAVIAQVRDAIGPEVPTLDEWEALWAASGLCDRSLQPHHVDAQAEIKSRVAWIGWPWLLRAWGRALRLYLSDPAARKSMKKQFDVSTEAYDILGYALLVGRK